MSALLLLFLAFRPFFSFSASPGLSEAGACFGCSPSAVGATGPRTTFSHSKRVGLDPKSASAPQTSQSTSQPACGALHHAVSGGLVHELHPRFPMPSPSFGTTHANGRQPPVPQSPLRSRSMHVPGDAWGRTSGNVPSIEARRATACSRHTPALVLSGVVCPRCRHHTAPWLAGSELCQARSSAPLPSYERWKLEPSSDRLDPEQQPLTCHVKPAWVPHPEYGSFIGSLRC